MAGFRDILELQGLWLSAPPMVAPAMGYYDILELSGVWLPRPPFIPPEPIETTRYRGFAVNTNRLLNQ